MSAGIKPFRRCNVEVTIEVYDLDSARSDEFIATIYREPEPMVDVLKISFQKKLVTDAVWQKENPQSHSEHT